MLKSAGLNHLLSPAFFMDIYYFGTDTYEILFSIFTFSASPATIMESVDFKI